MEGVFIYFVMIGAGLTTGIGIVALPSYWIYKKLSRKRGSTHDRII